MESTGELAHAAAEGGVPAADRSVRWVVNGGAHGKKYHSDGDVMKGRSLLQCPAGQD